MRNAGWKSCDPAETTTVQLGFDCEMDTMTPQMSYSDVHLLCVCSSPFRCSKSDRIHDIYSYYIQGYFVFSVF